MGVDYVDFLQIHNAPNAEPFELKGKAYTHLWIEDYLRPGGALEGLQRAQQQGKARFVLTSALTPDSEISRHVALHGDATPDELLAVLRAT